MRESERVYSAQRAYAFLRIRTRPSMQQSRHFTDSTQRPLRKLCSSESRDTSGHSPPPLHKCLRQQDVHSGCAATSLLLGEKPKYQLGLIELPPLGCHCHCHPGGEVHHRKRNLKFHHMSQMGQGHRDGGRITRKMKANYTKVNVCCLVSSVFYPWLGDHGRKRHKWGNKIE